MTDTIPSLPVSNGTPMTPELRMVLQEKARIGVGDFDRMSDALDAAHLAINEYYKGDRAWAEEWLLRAHEANQVADVARKRAAEIVNRDQSA